MSIIAISFDNTIYDTVTNLPKDNAADTINYWYDKGNYIIIWTSRYSYTDISFVKNKLKEFNIKYHKINKNDPTNDTYPKINADVFIDNKMTKFENNWGSLKSTININLNQYKTDIQTHTILSPCANDTMTPENIINKAIAENIKILGITDHSSTLNAPRVKLLAPSDMYILIGCEATSSEGAHCLCYFEDEYKLKEFQQYLDVNYKHNPTTLRQTYINKKGISTNITDKLYWDSLNVNMLEIEVKVHELNGIFIPSHINRGLPGAGGSGGGALAILGSLPSGIILDAIEVYNGSSIDDFKLDYPELASYTIIKDSDSHDVNTIGTFYNTFYLEKLTFNEIKYALNKQYGRHVICNF